MIFLIPLFYQAMRRFGAPIRGSLVGSPECIYKTENANKIANK
jgi:hypothetical protein